MFRTIVISVGSQITPELLAAVAFVSGKLVTVADGRSGKMKIRCEIFTTGSARVCDT